MHGIVSMTAHFVASTHRVVGQILYCRQGGLICAPSSVFSLSSDNSRVRSKHFPLTPCFGVADGSP